MRTLTRIAKYPLFHIYDGTPEHECLGAFCVIDLVLVMALGVGLAARAVIG